MSAAIALGAVVAALLVLALGKPVLRRLSWRAARRRPGQALVMIVGAALGTAIVTASLIVGDTLHGSLRAGAVTQLGPIDETVRAPGAEALPALRDALDGIEAHPQVDGVAFALRAEGTLAAPGEDAVEPSVGLLEADLERARALGGDPAATGLADPRTPREGETLLSRDVAEALDVEAGDAVRLLAFDRETTLQVTGVLPRRGVAGYGPEPGARRLNAFLAPGTLEALRPDGVAGPPIQATAFVSNLGGVLDGAEASGPVTEALRERVAAVPRAGVTAVKRQRLDAADAIGANLSELFLGVGGFAMLAGLVLVGNVFLTLALERRRELGLLRALGLGRAGVVGVHVLEGALYAAVAAGLGALAGIGVGAVIVAFAKGLSGGPAGYPVDLRFAASPASLATGAAVGFLGALLASVATSVQLARDGVVASLRDLPPAAPARRTRLAGRVLAVAAPLLAAAAAGAPLVWPEAFRDAHVGVFLLQGLVLVAGLLATLAVYGRPLARLLSHGAFGAPAARLALGYPRARPGRSLATLAMFALVTFTLVLTAGVAGVLGSRTDAFVQAEGGGYELLVEGGAGRPLPVASLRDDPAVRDAAPLRYAAYAAAFRAPGHDDFRRWFATGFDERLLDGGPPPLDRWLPSFGDARSAWRHVLDTPEAMIVDGRFLQEGGERQRVTLGNEVELRDPRSGTTVTRRVVGVAEGGFAHAGAYLSVDGLREVFGPFLPATRAYLDLTPDAAAAEVAARLEADFRADGLQARSFHEVVAAAQNENRAFLRLLQGYLMLGLLVAAGGVGAVLVRAVRERRRTLGALRAMGASAGTVARALTVEAGLLALLGVSLGAVAAVATGDALVRHASVLADVEGGLVLPLAQILPTLAVVLGASLLAAAWPARRAAGIPPAVALRDAE